MPTVSIIIPTLFPPPDFESYLQELSGFSQIADVIVVIDYKTKREELQINTPPNVRVHKLKKHSGFTGACNAGANMAKGDYLMFLNDDCTVTREAFSALVEFLQMNPDVVATQPIVYKGTSTRNRSSHNEKPDVENVGFWVDTTIGKSYPIRKTLNPKLETLNIRNEINRIYGLSGTCLMIRREIFMKVGMFDEAFHSYLEDVDLAIRLYKGNYAVAPCLTANVAHKHMATSSAMGLYKPMQDVKNWWRLILKHTDIFISPSTLLPILVERGRNLSGLIKAAFNI